LAGSTEEEQFAAPVGMTAAVLVQGWTSSSRMQRVQRRWSSKQKAALSSPLSWPETRATMKPLLTDQQSPDFTGA